MGLLFNSAAILASGITAGSLYLGLGPVWAFLLGALILYAPLKNLLPIGKSKKPVSETGIVSSLITILFFSFWNYSVLYSSLMGIAAGYLYLYWWLFIFPKIFLPKNDLKSKLGTKNA